MSRPTGVPNSWRTPRQLGELTLRTHRCAHCSKTYLSIQQVLTMEMVEALESGVAWELMQSYERTQDT